MSAPRPGVHFTVPRGHVNDPLGVTWHAQPGGGARYELFFQYNPAGPAWVPECRWGQAHAADLVRWRDPRTALEPAAEGEGCWSGAVAVAPDGTPTIVYTSVDAADPAVGRVALARGRPDWTGWTVDPAGPVGAGPPPELDLRHFRDPCVWRDGDGWRMVLGGGSGAGRAMALLYRSPDLAAWRYEGVLAERDTADPDPVETGSLWECPQLFPLDGAWVLLVSAWDGDPLRVLAAVGELDGGRFTARSWQHLDATGEVYATSAFADAAGRRCAVSWVPGTGAGAGPWAGLLTLPHLLALEGDRLVVRPHPDVDTLRGPLLTAVEDATVDGPVELAGPADPLLDVELRAAVPPRGRLVLSVRGDAGEVLRVEAGRDAVVLRRPGRSDGELPVRGDGRVDLRLLLDVGVAEVFGAGAPAVLRLDATDGGPVRLTLSGEGDVRLEHARVHALNRWFRR